MALFSRTPKKSAEDNSTIAPPIGAKGAGNSSSGSQSGLSSTVSFFSRLTGSRSRTVPGQIRAESASFGTDNTISKSVTTSDANISSGSNGGSSMTISSQDNIGNSHLGGGGGQGRNSRTLSGDKNGSNSVGGLNDKVSYTSYRVRQFERVLDAENVDGPELRALAWRGIPPALRPLSWQLMLGYIPFNKARRAAALTKKRKEYADAIQLYFDARDSADKTVQEQEALRQIQVDLPRTCPDLYFYHQKAVQRMMERILYIWSIRHPASGYVQGMNDVLTPILLVATQPYILTSGAEMTSVDALRFDVDSLSAETLLNIEADAYWQFSKLLDGVQDHYTFSQPGLQRMVLRLEDLMSRVCPRLHAHFAEEGVQYMQFAFRWMNCFLLRELPLPCILRLWDTYFAEERAGFESFHVHVCAVLTKYFEPRLLNMPFQDMVMFLQDIPTKDWGEKEVDEVVSEAFVLSHVIEAGDHS